MQGGVGKAPVMGLRSLSGEVHAFPVARADAPTLHGHICKHVDPGTQVYTDAYASYRGMCEYRQESVAHDTDEYMRGQVHTNGIESFWSLLKRGHIGMFHQMSLKHLSRYVDEFCFRHNHRNLYALAFMKRTAASMVGRFLPNSVLIQEVKYGGTGNPTHSRTF